MTGVSAPAFLPYSRPLVDDDDVAAVTAALQDPMISQGTRLTAFEAAFARQVGAAEAVAFSSGTAALHAMCFAAGLGPGDEVIVPALTFAGTANAVLYVGARPVFADIDPDTLCLDPGAVRRALTPRTRAFLPVDFAGHPADYAALAALAGEAGAVVLADAAHAPGARRQGRPVGSLADMTAFSFNPVKNMTSAEGGMVTTDDPERAARLRQFRVHGMTRDADRLEAPAPGGWYYEQQFLGYNYKLSELHAALGLSQLARLEAYNARRRALAACYDARLAALPLVLPGTARGVLHARHLYVVQVLPPFDRDALFATLREQGFGVQVHYIPVPLHPHYRRLGYTLDDCPHVAHYYAGALSLPLHPAMTEADVDRVVHALQRFFETT